MSSEIKITAKISALLLVATVAAFGFLYGCTPSSTDDSTDQNTDMDVSDKSVDQQEGSTSETTGEAADLFSEACTLKGEVLGAQHINGGGGDLFMVSLAIEPDLPAELEARANQSKWNAALYFVVEDADGNYVGSWAPDPVEYDWTFSDRIEDNEKHASIAQDLKGAHSVSVYLMWAKGTFPDGSVAEFNTENDADLSNDQAGAQAAEANGQLIGKQRIDIATM
ncbi:hypothetical protein [Adlercreutzia sp. ZJ141]|uniref:hypothetical protein n=1 Tax=Adlercreutzia sp. ZJ141 TaxID=2709406 RepID=UPI0013EB962C|nr:hypothetical protein [Adlercreutzia sp. ZJ141]